ncbi:uncharacterized protein (DUF2236 family) [Kineosphaera limosa]|uniref:ER-bound oxygenase mpaB/mpaB'/Rubber oxygenase catalytic domain-containing protein n=1 Tax=Kineosphaera limosa NBRC 100340 TaxID=1184609 RepID=K6X6W9_9MICO|nr:oxygenase MpaB family protein [Kineosphaera limosa]NYD99444.1 uncharacterized protein (DUF2236 family) [Kineosphaera limosa]GAB94574.1 hypothetical protein KILIM_007_00120 [Kineosphaera limosa NBRC 100340]
MRVRLAHALRSRVAGDDADAEAAKIWGASGPRWFTPDDPVWRVHADASMFVGGIRALLLQSLHPLAMAGVAGHSGYKSDPWGRLQRTSRFIATTTFSTVSNAEAAIAHVRAVHERVRGRAQDGRTYRASDPHLLAWVHAAEADSFLSCFQAYGPGRLTAAECDRYVEQSGRSAAALGVLDPPTTLAELRATLAQYRPELQATCAAREAAAFLLREPPLPWSARPGYAMLAAGAVADLPDWARAELGLRARPALGRPLGIASAGLVRWALSDPAVARQRRARL